VAGFSEGTKEFIVAGGRDDGGDNLDTAEIIDFYKGLLPAEFGVRERGQEFMGDTNRGEDKLDIDVVAEVLVEMLLDKNMTDPFVLGVLGRWGLGKSYFFNRMKEHIIKFQKMKADKTYQENFAGHIYVVEFDAWTYSKGVVASSLMYEILKTLNEQLQLENFIGDQDLKNGVFSVLEVLRDNSEKEVDYIKEKYETIRNEYLKFKKKGDVASEPLLKAIYDTYEEDEKELKTNKEEIIALEEDLETKKTCTTNGIRKKETKGI
jgi:predicted KAP-like P-loop ATPase